MAEHRPTTPHNDWCHTLGIEPPALESVTDHPEANNYALLIVALLERGQPMTLLDVAARFEQAGIADSARALLSLQRCKPARLPVYRDGDIYQLDPRHDELRMWVSRLDLRPRATAPKAASAFGSQAELRPDLFSALDEQRPAVNAQERMARSAVFAQLRRGLLIGFPARRPEAVALLDTREHTIATFVRDELVDLRDRLNAYDVLGAVDVRALLRSINFDHGGGHQLAELRPPQKTKKLNQRGRVLKITPELLVRGSCGIARPFADQATMTKYLAKVEVARLRKGLEADVKSLYALYEYGRLHGAVRLRWGFLDEFIGVPWVHHDEPRLHDLKSEARLRSVPLEVVVGNAPGWREPWSRARLAHVEPDPRFDWNRLVDDAGYAINDRDVQRARLATSPSTCAPTDSVTTPLTD